MKFAILTVLFAVASCNYTIEKAGNNGPIRVSEALLSSISFNQVKIEVFQNKCISCHGNSGGVNLESYSAAYQHLEAIKRTTLDSNSMPKSPYPSLNRRELELITAWVEAGGPDKPRNGTQGPDDRPTKLEPTFSSIRKNVIQMKCLSCHQPGGTAARIPLNTREDLIDSPLEIVIPNNPDDSGLMIVTEEGARRFMPPANSGISPLTEEERNAIRIWIENGAL